jgi:hypothetical protein
MSCTFVFVQGLFVVSASTCYIFILKNEWNCPCFIQQPNFMMLGFMNETPR